MGESITRIGAETELFKVIDLSKGNVFNNWVIYHIIHNRSYFFSQNGTFQTIEDINNWFLKYGSASKSFQIIQNGKIIYKSEYEY